SSTLTYSGGNLTYGTLAFDSGAVALAITGDSELADNGTLRITNGAHVDTGYFDMAISPSSGTLLVDGAGSRITSAFVSDWPASNVGSATVTFSNSGAGTFHSLNVSAVGANALVNLNTGGILNTTSALVAGGFPNAAATINVSGGILNSMGTALFGKGALVNLTSGTASFAGNATFSGGS